jgi:hypothetical protein
MGVNRIKGGSKSQESTGNAHLPSAATNIFRRVLPTAGYEGLAAWVGAAMAFGAGIWYTQVGNHGVGEGAKVLRGALRLVWHRLQKLDCAALTVCMYPVAFQHRVQRRLRSTLPVISWSRVCQLTTCLCSSWSSTTSRHLWWVGSITRLLAFPLCSLLNGIQASTGSYVGLSARRAYGTGPGCIPTGSA